MGKVVTFPAIPLEVLLVEVPREEIDYGPSNCDLCGREVQPDENVQLTIDPDTHDTELVCSHCLDGRTLRAVD